MSATQQDIELFIDAATNGHHSDIVRILLAIKSVREEIATNIVETNKKLNLRTAASRGQAEIVERLLEDKEVIADAQNVEEAGLDAYCNGHTEVAKLLFRVIHNDEEAAKRLEELRWAAQNSHVETLKLLRDNSEYAERMTRISHDIKPVGTAVATPDVVVGITAEPPTLSFTPAYTTVSAADSRPAATPAVYTRPAAPVTPPGM